METTNTNESHKVTNNKGKEITFLEIENGKRRILLNYMAGEALHDNGLKEHVLAFLNDKQRKNECSDITSYFNASIYFIVPSLTDTSFKELNTAFELHMAPFEEQYKGDFFWIFNAITTMTVDGVSKSILLGKAHQDSFVAKPNK